MNENNLHGLNGIFVNFLSFFLNTIILYMLKTIFYNSSIFIRNKNIGAGFNRSLSQI